MLYILLWQETTSNLAIREVASRLEIVQNLGERECILRLAITQKLCVLDSEAGLFCVENMYTDVVMISVFCA